MLVTLAAGCVIDPTRSAEGPVEVALAPRLSLQVPRHLAYLPPSDGLKLMSALGERPGAEVLGVIVTRAEPTPRMLIIFAKSRDAQGTPALEFVGWDEVPEVGTLINEMLLARERM
jgi:uncharacterized membrane-anchored protein